MELLLRVAVFAIKTIARTAFPIIVFLNIGPKTGIESRIDVIGDTAYIVGYLSKGMEEKFSNIKGQVKVVVLKSAGGFVGVATVIADVVHNNNMTTIVYDYCYSACTIIFASGKQRFAHPKATFLIHGAHIEGRNRSQYTATAIFQLNAAIINRFIGYGVDEAFIRENVTYPQPMFDSVFSANTALQINLATSIL